MNGEKAMSDYITLEEIRQTDISTLFCAVKKTQNKKTTALTYLIKKYNVDASEELIKNEITISQTIEESCPSSVIIPVLESFQENGVSCIVMQFRKNGMFLNDIIKYLEEKYGDGKIPLNITLEIIRGILKSLSILHEYKYNGKKLGVLHLDLNPGNIFFESADPEKEHWGTVKFIDFGGSIDRQNKEEVLKGRNWHVFTRGYSAPEMEDMIVSHILPSTDLYSVCACMLRMIVGSTFHEIKEESICKILNKKYDPLISDYIQAIVKNASSCPSYYRYQNAFQMEDDINSLINFLSYIEDGDYYRLLAVSYEKSFPNTKMLKKSRIIIESGFTRATEQLKKDLLLDHVYYPKCLYIFEGLYYIGREHGITRSMQSLLESGLSCYNSMGQTSDALRLYKELYPFISSLTISSSVTTTLRYAVTAANCWHFEDAYKIVRSLIQGMEAFKNCTQQKDNIGITELGRAYSAAGTYLAFQRKGNPMEMYQKALQEFRNDTGNCKITYSKILHYALDADNHLLFKEYAPLYFSGFPVASKDFLEQSAADGPYVLFLYLKCIYYFYPDTVDQEFCNHLKTFLDNEYVFEKVHPEPLILKYAALLFYRIGDKDNARSYIEQSIRHIRAGEISKEKKLNLTMLMSYQTLWTANEEEGKSDANQKLLESVMEKCNVSPWENLHTALSRENSLCHILCHEYC